MTSAITDFKRFSNSPLTLAPACNKPKSRLRTATSLNGSGTSPDAIRRAKPSTTAVLPTPASPVNIGLFWRRRIRISIICLISSSRPRTASIFPCLAASVKLTVNLSREGVLLGVAGPLENEVSPTSTLDDSLVLPTIDPTTARNDSG